ncbi:uncharacterized protein BDR25DRAFT_11142 [Lindgomyces ingoldianus]|uniref:Uncharacterized protein n=1 Tax=Lindgomyces ingoldianus TaxID=673940 RepID=A0ACB6R2Q4_9PLEO|nr:uncharacterized protein BDR25DRAFT_11142 [Lindgomyces ingoldianus]KAF2472716.1 hypothetical protein BDR25DRAFT_11142 [Lindgomyces ingoldianus]
MPSTSLYGQSIFEGSKALSLCLSSTKSLLMMSFLFSLLLFSNLSSLASLPMSQKPHRDEGSYVNIHLKSTFVPLRRY